MAMVVKNNMTALTTLNTLNKNQSALSSSLAKVSSGVKINSAKDDASGYAISERMRVMVRSLDQANQNAQNGASMMKVAEGAVGNTVEILRTLKEKALSAATDTKTDDDRATIQKEIDQFVKQIDDNALVTFNGKYLLDGSKTQRADFSTKTALTNQSLSKSTKGTTALVDLMSRKDESLLINDTDIVQASFVVNGKTYTTSYQVSDTTLQDIFTALNEEAEEDGIVAFGKANTDMKTVSSVVGDSDAFKALTQSSLMLYSKDISSISTSDQIIANAAAFLEENSLKDVRNDLTEQLTKMLKTNLYMKYTPIGASDSGTGVGDIVVPLPGDSTTSSATVVQDAAYESTSKSASSMLGGYAGIEAMVSKVLDVAQSQIATYINSSNFSNNLNELALQVIGDIAGSGSVVTANSDTSKADVENNAGSTTYLATGTGTWEASWNTNSDTLLDEITTTAKTYAYAYLADAIVNQTSTDTVKAGVSGKSSAAFEAAYQLSNNADQMVNLLGNTDSLSATEDLVKAAKAYAATDDREDALKKLATTLATEINSYTIDQAISNTLVNTNLTYYLTTADGDHLGYGFTSGTGVASGTALSELAAANGGTYVAASDSVISGLSSAIDKVIDDNFDTALKYLQDNNSELTVSNIYEVMTDSTSKKEGAFYKFMTGFKLVNENGDEIKLSAIATDKAAIAALATNNDNFKKVVESAIAAKIGALTASTDNGLVFRSSDIGRGASQNLVSTADGELGLTITAGTAGMNYQISGLSVRITDSSGQSRTAVNEFLDAFHTTIFAGNKSDDNSLVLHTGSQAGQSISVSLDDMRAQALGLKGLDNSIVSVANVQKANAAVSVFETALQKALDIQTTIGAIEARLDYTSSNLTTSSENVQAAESTIRDADMAKEMTEYTKNNVLLQAAQSMLAQANQNSSAVLSLLQ